MEAFTALTLCTTLLLLILSIVLKTLPKTKTIYLNRTLPRASWYKFRIPFVEGYITMIKMRKAGVRINEKLIQQYGSSFMIPFANTELLYATDPNLVKKILSSNQPQHLNKPKFYELIVSEALMHGILCADYNVWSVRRKTFTPACTYKGFSSYIKFMTNESQVMVKHALKLASEKSSHCISHEDIKEPMDFCLSNIIDSILIGTNINVFSEADRAISRTTFLKWKTLAIDRYLHPEQFIPIVWMFHPRKQALEKCMNIINGYTNQITNKYRELAAEAKNKTGDNEENAQTGVKPFQCMMEQMIQAGFTNEEIIEEMNTLQGAGFETMSTTLDFLLYHLAKNPEWQEKCYEEICQVLKFQHADLNKHITMDELSEMKCLERCILEGMRLTPAVPFFCRRIDAPLEIDEKTSIEGNSVVGISPWAVHRNPEVWPNPEQFDPERFLPENVQQRHSGAYIPFSMGPRNCIGWKIAMMELKMIMAWILRYFEMSTEDNLEDVKLVFDITLKAETPLNVELTRRGV